MDNKGKKGGIFKILLPIGIFIIVVMIAFGGSKKSSARVIKASADSVSVFIPDNCYMLHTFYNPQIYVSWSNNGNYTTLLYPPVLYITPSSYQCSFGDVVYTLSSSYTTGIECQSWQVQAQNPNTPNGYEVSFEGQVFGNNISSLDLYNNLVSGNYTFSRIVFNNICRNVVSGVQNGFSYLIYIKDSNNIEYLGASFYFTRNESVPSNISDLYISSSNIDFSYTFTFNGNATGEEAYNEGYRLGRTRGHTEGYNEGLEASSNYSFLSLFTSVLDAPLTTFKSLLNFNLLGINILSFATSIITAVILIKVLKLILGG